MGLNCTLVCWCFDRDVLTHTDVFIVQRQRGIFIVAQATVLTLLTSRVVLAAHACDRVDEVNVAAAVGVTIALTV